MKNREKVTIGHLWGAFYPILMYLGITVVAGVILTFIALGQGQITVENKTVDFGDLQNNFSLMMTFFGALMTAPLLILIKYLDVKKQRMIGAYGYKSVFFAKYLFIIPFAISFMYVANMVVVILEKLIPSIAHSFDETAKAIYGADLWIQIATAVILGPIVEELIFRGLMYIRLKRMFGAGVAAFVTGLVFGLFHMNISQGVYAFIFSYGAIFVYERYKNICAPILFHMAANAISVLVTFMVKDYNTSAGNNTANVSTSSEWVGIIIVLVVSVSISGLFALCIKKWVDPQPK
ncbi:MAG: CPBP family intramembrane metalloprotease [Eubacterium sp.]|nr:CPBP family intramembrane metalloprotease [Eubacterium sp.]